MSRKIHYCRTVTVLCTLASALMFTACTEKPGPFDRDLIGNEGSMVVGKLYAQVIVPAGSSDSTHTFLPYPANWCAVLTTDSLLSLRAMVITDGLRRGSVLAVEPVAVLQLDSAGSRIDLLVAIPTDTTLQTVKLEGFVDLLTDYEPIRYILQTWFVNHRGYGTFEVIGWKDEKYALQLFN